MDAEKNKQNHQPEQNELDLEFNQVEPITPKKTTKHKPSLLDKAKGVMAMFKSNKSHPSQRQEPTLGNDNIEQGNNDADVLAHTDEPFSPTDSHISEEQHYQSEQVSTPAFNWKQPETWPFLQKLPQKHRRIVVVLIAFIILLLLFLWLKPDTTTVDSLHSQNQHNLPIEFQPLDQSLVVTEVEATQNTENVETIISETNTDPSTTALATNIAENVVLPSNQPVVQETIIEEQAVALPPTRNNAQSSAAQPRQSQPARSQTQASSTTSQSRQTSTAERTRVQSSNRSAPVVEAARANTSTSSTTTGTTKTLTINKGVTLMQVFRDNNLNIADVNAMTRANGAGNVLSSFKPGDKVQVSVQSNGRVSELRLQDGSRFIRQSDGNYIYRK